MDPRWLRLVGQLYRLVSLTNRTRSLSIIILSIVTALFVFAAIYSCNASGQQQQQPQQDVNQAIESEIDE